MAGAGQRAAEGGRSGTEISRGWQERDRDQYRVARAGERAVEGGRYGRESSRGWQEWDREQQRVEGAVSNSRSCSIIDFAAYSALLHI